MRNNIGYRACGVSLKIQIPSSATIRVNDIDRPRKSMAQGTLTGTPPNLIAASDSLHGFSFVPLRLI